MNRKSRILAVAAMAVIFLSAVILAVYFSVKPRSDRVNIISGGQTVRTIDLSTAEDCQFDIIYEGRRNTVEIKNHTICVISADCPDLICVKTGAMGAGSSGPVVCLPNRLVIEFEEVSADGKSG